MIRRTVEVCELYEDADVPAPRPCDRCGADLAGRRYAMRPVASWWQPMRPPADARILGACWCEPCAAELIARDGTLIPAALRALAAHALGAREWAARYASDAQSTRVARDVPAGEAIAAWRRELLSSSAVFLDEGRRTPQWLLAVWWTEPLEPLSRLERLRRAGELAEAFGVRLADVEVRR